MTFDTEVWCPKRHSPVSCQHEIHFLRTELFPESCCEAAALHEVFCDQEQKKLLGPTQEERKKRDLTGVEFRQQNAGFLHNIHERRHCLMVLSRNCW